MSQFKIPPESILFVKTADDVTVKFRMELAPKANRGAANRCFRDEVNLRG